MKTIRKTQMESFEAETLKDFTARFNTAMAWVGRVAEKYNEPVVNLEMLRGFVIYTVIERIPEGIQDILDLENERLSCAQCRHFERTYRNNGLCKKGCCRGELRAADEPCGRFFKSWENGECWLREGEGYDYIEDRFRREKALQKEA